MNVDLTGYIEEVYRIGRKSSNNRPLVIELLSKRMVKYILSNGRYLQGTRVAVSDFLDENARKKRQILREEIIKARRKGLHASAELSELEVTDSALEASHSPVLARSLRPVTCRLRALCLQRVALCGEPLLCLVIALKSNNSIRELRLGDNGLSISDAGQLASLLEYNNRIQLLDLSNNQIQDAGVAQLADAMAEQAAQSPPSAAASPLSPHRCQGQSPPIQEAKTAVRFYSRLYFEDAVFSEW
ncbi:unnamed protein product [Arctia plantaginis]|uniref:Uncharacterized protein n=1 Tax=Arctia plantaginis TaxID=874455 RepID=A0A8S1AJL4_ARCPL|nr:unnamed protein product [Arctia plantaginis]